MRMHSKSFSSPLISITLLILINIVLAGYFLINQPEKIIYGESYAVLWPTHYSMTDVIKTTSVSGGTVMRMTSKANIAIIATTDSRFLQNAYANGAILIFNPRLASACAI